VNRQTFIFLLAGLVAFTTAGLRATEPSSEQNIQRAASGSDLGAPLPSGADVIGRLLERSSAMAAATNAPAWAYDKLTVMEKLDGDAKVEERTEKLYRVQIINGVPISRLVKIAGRDLNEAELAKQNQREASFQKQLSGRDPKKAVSRRESFVTKDVIERFEYTSLRREAVQGRQTVVLGFAPKSGKDSGSFQERLFNRMEGTLWVDEATGDVARLEVHLTKGFSLGVLGVLGSIKECRMNLESKPMVDGTWLPEKTTMSISARMLLTSVRFHMEETSTNFVLEKVTETTRGKN